MEKVIGIGGAFWRAKDPEGLMRWYTEHLGIDSGLEGDTMWSQEAGTTVIAPFPMNTDYFGNKEQMFMLNFRVRNLETMLQQLRDKGVKVDEKRENMEGVGLFGWAFDPEGNKFELWEPIS